MRKLLLAALIALSALTIDVGASAAASAPIEAKPSGVVVIGGDVAASAGTPSGGIAYVADGLGR